MALRSQSPPDRTCGVRADAVSHAFVIRLWLEEAAGFGQSLWRGHITHVPSGERQYLLSLDDVRTFMAIHVPGVSLGTPRAFLYRLWLRLKKRLPQRLPRL